MEIRSTGLVARIARPSKCSTRCQCRSLVGQPSICAPRLAGTAPASTPTPEPGADLAFAGVVYMIRVGDYHKVGRSNDLDRRTREPRI